ncbi:MAG: hypothetical protein AB8I08_10170 [Sandaracinaceae bacterium]
MSPPAVVFLFGVLVIGIFAAVSSLAATSLAIGLSYVPYVLYALNKKRPKLRLLRQFGVFALAWSILTTLVTLVLLMNADFSARDAHMTAFGVDVLSGWLLGALAAPIPFVLIAGEVLLYLLRQRIPPETPDA